MSFEKNKKNKIEYQAPPKLTVQELQKMEEEYREAGGRIGFLVKKNAIKLYSNGAFSVLMNTDGSIPYTEWSRKIGELEDFIARREYREKLEIFNKTGQWPQTKAIADFKNSIKNIIDTKAIKSD